jgi:hypothetical protein
MVKVEIIKILYIKVKLMHFQNQLNKLEKAKI